MAKESLFAKIKKLREKESDEFFDAEGPTASPPMSPTLSPKMMLKSGS